MFGKQTHKHHHSTSAKSEFDSFNKNPLELARSPVTSSAASAGISASVAVVSPRKSSKQKPVDDIGRMWMPDWALDPFTKFIKL